MLVLLCTVGGSHQPIVRSITETQPDFVWFICSEDDPDTGRSGSWEQITKPGLFIKESYSDSKPTLANIPTQLSLQDTQYDHIRVLADELDDAYRKILAVIEKYPAADTTVVVDYTGGTKTMSAALCVAALSFDHVDIQLITGSRANLSKVTEGSEEKRQARTLRTRFQQRYRQAMQAWQRFDYDSVGSALSTGKIENSDDRGQAAAAKNLSQAFAAWDRFDHHTAIKKIEPYMGKYSTLLGPYMARLRLLTGEQSNKEPAQLQDLWLNAQRRAKQEKYDDATARAYRLLEWSAQWQLREFHNIDTADVPADKLPPQTLAQPNTTGKIQCGLRASWEILAHLDQPGSVVEQFWRDNNERLQDLLALRNYSILAHGFTSISKKDWQRIESFIEAKLMPVLQEVFKASGYRFPALQLPQSLEGQKA